MKNKSDRNSSGVPHQHRMIMRWWICEHRRITAFSFGARENCNIHQHRIKNTVVSYVRQTLCRGLPVMILTLLTGCGVILHHYPEPNVGWHSKDYSIVFGVLSAHDTNPVSWTIRYASIYAGDTFGGKFALTPTSRLVGFQPGNTVEIYGHPEPKILNKAGTGTLYHVQSIRLWLGKGRPSYMTR